MMITFWPSVQHITDNTQGSATIIVRDSAWTVVMGASADGTHNYCMLPSGCDVGDVVEVHDDGSSGFGTNVLPPSGETMIGGVSITAPRLFRKVGASTWSYLS